MVCEGIQEVGRRADTGQIVIRIDSLFRPAEVETLLETLPRLTLS